MKECSACHIEYKDGFFVKNNGRCKLCRSAYSKKYYLLVDKDRKAKHYKDNREEYLDYQKDYYENNKIKIEEYRKDFYIKNRELIIEKQLIRDNNRKEDIAIYNKKYRQENKDKYILYKANKRSKPVYKLRCSISNAVYQALKINSSSKNNISFVKHINYSINELKQYLESLFEPWMTWDNWGVYNPKTWDDNDQSTWVWQLDHIIPQADLPYTSMEDDNFKKCWALDNLRPLSAKQNCFDGAFNNKNRKSK